MVVVTESLRQQVTSLHISTHFEYVINACFRPATKIGIESTMSKSEMIKEGAGANWLPLLGTAVHRIVCGMAVQGQRGLRFYATGVPQLHTMN